MRPMRRDLQIARMLDVGIFLFLFGGSVWFVAWCVRYGVRWVMR